MEKVTQATAATAEESAAASEELNAQAEGTIAVVHQLEALVGAARKLVSVHTAQAHPAAADSATHVVTMPRRTAMAPQARARRAVEEQNPFGDTGTFGKF